MMVKANAKRNKFGPYFESIISEVVTFTICSTESASSLVKSMSMLFAKGMQTLASLLSGKNRDTNDCAVSDVSNPWTKTSAQPVSVECPEQNWKTTKSSNAFIADVEDAAAGTDNLPCA